MALKGAATHQYERSVIKQIFRVDIRSLCDHLLAHLQIASPTRFAQSAEVLAIVERIVLFEDAILDQFLFLV